MEIAEKFANLNLISSYSIPLLSLIGAVLGFEQCNLPNKNSLLGKMGISMKLILLILPRHFYQVGGSTL